MANVVVVVVDFDFDGWLVVVVGAKKCLAGFFRSSVGSFVRGLLSQTEGKEEEEEAEERFPFYLTRNE